MDSSVAKFTTEREKACLRMGLDKPAPGAGVVAFIKNVGKWEDILIDYVSHLAGTNESYRNLLQAHGMASPTDRRALWPEDYLAHCEIEPAVFLGDLTRVAHQVGGARAATLASIALPKVVQASVKAARSVKSGAKDREMLFKITGALPTPKGASIIVNTHGASASILPAGQDAGSAVAALPAYEATMEKQMHLERPEEEVVDAEFDDI